MTTWYPISFTVPQYEDANGVPYSGAVLKAYEAGTSTPLLMATTYTGATTATSFVLNASGYPTSAGSVIIPHLSENFKLCIYPTQAAADANSGALWTVDNIQIAQSTSAARIVAFAADTGAANAYVIAPDPAVSAYSDGMFVTLVPTNTLTGAATLTVSGLAAINIKLKNGNDPFDKAMVAGGAYNLVYYSGNFILQNPAQKPATRQYLTSGTAATYTTPANCKAILVRMVGGGGGGGAVATNAGSAGGDTSFNSIVAKGGSGGAISVAGGGVGGAGGTAGTGSATFRQDGQAGAAGSTISHPTGAGGNSRLGPGAQAKVGNGTGNAAAANTGGGGSGGNNGNNCGSGGGSGEYVELYIATPSATYTYTVWAGGAGGSAGTQAGGAGGSGMIIVEEFY